MFKVWAHHHIGKRFYFYRPYLGLHESNEMKVLRFLKKTLKIKGSLFIDVGACHGMYVFWFCDDFKKVVAFEPAQKKLTLNYVCRVLKKHNVEILKKAVYHHTGTVKLFVGTTDFAHSIKKGRRDVSKKFCAVGATTLNNFIREPVDLIKVDVQGATFDVLKGAKKVMDKISKWVIELEIDELQRKTELEQLMESFNYKTMWLSNQHLYASQ